MSTASLIAHLVPLNAKLEEEDNPKIPLARGVNYVGRDTVPFNDKRLSRRHIVVKCSGDGSSAHINVEGVNPVVVRSNSERKKLFSGEKCEIRTGDVIELIPGHYFFKFVYLANNDSIETSPNTSQKRRLSNENLDHSRKRMQKAPEDEALVRKSNAELGDNDEEPQLSSENMRQFRVSKDKLPQTFKLMRVKELPEWANTNSVSISDVIQGNVLVAILSNYMIDLDWLLSACPMLRRVPNVLVIHGEGDGTLEYMKRNKPSSWILHKPPLPISYGTHHSKAMILVYPGGVRVIVHTANLIYVDWNNKTQGLWMQDFPWKEQNNSGAACDFENDLIDYLKALKWPEFNVKIPSMGSFTINPSFFSKFDYRSAGVRLIASVPGYHSGSNLRKWGHMKFRTVLQDCTFDQQFEKSPLIYQFSSLGSLDEKWMTELATSMSAGITEDKKALGLGKPSIIWPSVEDVRSSLEGYAAGNAIPSPLKNVEKEFLKKYWSKWKARHTGRCRAMPHIKTFARYNGQDLAWMLLTSANLSKAAWGALQKNNSQLMIRSYELGVLFLPFSRKFERTFSCTDDALEDVKHVQTSSQVKRTRLVTLAWNGKRDEEDDEVIRLPLPYELPPKPYSSEDVPWSWDRRYTEKDVYGQVWPRTVKLYTSQDV